MPLPEPAPLSPLAFTRAYQQYRAEAAGLPFIDAHLLRAARFWSTHEAALGAGIFTAYWLEDLPPLLGSINPDRLGDLLPSEVEEVARFIDKTIALLNNLPEGRESLSRLIREQLAKQWLFLGEPGKCLEALAAAGRKQLPSPDQLRAALGDDSLSDATEIPSILVSAWTSAFPDVSRWLDEFDANWRRQREDDSPDHAHCLLVEYDSFDRPVRGRMQRLRGQIEPLNPRAEADEVIFHHQVRSAEGPFFRAIYNALSTLRQPRGRVGARPGSSGPRYQGRFSFDRAQGEVFSGDSIGLAAFAVAYGSCWSREVRRQRARIAATAGFTGGIDAEGHVVPVADESLPLKVSRAFHSSITHLIVPQANRAAAESAVENLRQTYPRRRLHIVGVERVEDILNDNNIFRRETLWIGEYAARKAARLSRNVKVQAPLLAALLYALVCLVYPKAWVGFDRNPAFVRTTATGIRVLNVDRHPLWSWNSPCEAVDTVRSVGVAADIDGDRKNEVAVLLASAEGIPCAMPAALHVFGHDGRLRFSRSAAIFGEYPGDSAVEQRFSNLDVDVVKISTGTRIMTRVDKSDPARAHFQFWAANGKRTGWYVQAGFGGTRPYMAVIGDHVCIAAYNNRMNGAAALFALSPDSSQGCSPPYVDPRHPEYDLSWARRGNQTAYVVFPRTDLSLAKNRPYSDPWQLWLDSKNLLALGVGEAERGVSRGITGICYSLNDHFRVCDAEPDDDFFLTRDPFVMAGALPPADPRTYLAALRDSVRYWTDSGWVTEGQLRLSEMRR